jgi:hypothetical protein
LGEAIAPAMTIDIKGCFLQGVALEAEGGHAEALASFRAAQTAWLDDSRPVLHAKVAHLALGDASAVVVAASDVCWRAPDLPPAMTPLAMLSRPWGGMNAPNSFAQP